MNTNTQNTSNTSNKAMIVLFVLFLLSSVGMFGQNKETAVAAPATTTTVEVVKVSVNAVALDSDVEFMNWFMSSKQAQSVNNVSESTSSTNVSKKKQIISSGVIPNKLLYRTLVKKVISQESAIA